MQRLMVTGGAGFIGSNFVRYMLEKYPKYTIVVYDKLTYAGRIENLQDVAQTYKDRYAFVKGDICDMAAVEQTIQDHNIDTIVNFAAETHVDRSLMNPVRLSKPMSTAPTFCWKQPGNLGWNATIRSAPTRFTGRFWKIAPLRPISLLRAALMPPAKPAVT